MNVKYPNIEVQLSGEDGNSFFIIGRVTHALRRGGVSREEVDRFREQAMRGNYDNVLRTCMEWVNVR
jgi:hypothetical protein